MKNAIIIGGTSGIGRSLGEKLLANGWTVGITGRRTELLAEIKKKSENKILTQVHDISDLESSDDSMKSLFSQFETVDLVVVSSGQYVLNEGLDWELDKSIINTNVLGINKVYEFVFSKFKEQGFGHIVGISSISAIRGSRLCPSYSASKAYQSNYLEAIRCISKKQKLNIIVTDVQPGYIDTAMAKNEHVFWVVPLPKATNQIYRGILKGKRKFYVSKRWILFVVLLKIAPSWVLEKTY